MARRNARRKRSRHPTRSGIAAHLARRHPWRVRSWNVKRFFKILADGIAAFGQAPVAARIGMLLFFAASAADGILMPFFALWAHQVAGIPIVYIGVLLGCYAGGELL